MCGLLVPQLFPGSLQLPREGALFICELHCCHGDTTSPLCPWRACVWVKTSCVWSQGQVYRALWGLAPPDPCSMPECMFGVCLPVTAFTTLSVPQISSVEGATIMKWGKSRRV